ncbi:PREDICTED: pentatricopeptide repeat-containing protein At1g77405-like [Camelina sativa]|uniref:Pentatricopeptide repeat-containing protein At1g77405-like n=1 Tax=Camelina sativa TaxID=90675 RepID=A0ABM0SVD2_CAMSA|nr:PREDICTED: pentatricopeptide repeat-containing protein At1g77405-like [Camelina sativa]XP_010416684.1 PREDICTED: pentatricopeptide repeat-containing protein At1g77405-like [Camelina sativa]
MKPSQCNRVIDQLIAAMIQNRPFDAVLASSTVANPWSQQLVSDVLRSIPRFFFISPRSIGRQKGFRHRSPLKQRNLREESQRRRSEVLVLGPAAYMDPKKVSLGLQKAMEFFFWIETHFGFDHNEVTGRDMACLLAKGNDFTGLWDFLRQVSRRENGKNVVTTASVTCLMKCLGEEGFVKEALATFYRMKEYHCKPDVYAYNTIINALCRVANFKKARFLLDQMQLPGFRYPPDIYTYTILISSYCRYGMQTGCRKAIRRRMWEANRMFREMLFRGFVPDVVTYNCLIDGCCKTNRIGRALELFEDMKKRGCVPNQVTYNSFIRYYSVTNEIERAIEMMRTMKKMDHGVPGSSTYTPLIHALVETRRAAEARDLVVEMVEAGVVPREYTYKLVLDALSSEGMADTLDEELHKRMREGIEERCRRVMRIKPVMARKEIVGKPDFHEIEVYENSAIEEI